jgi:hypothetical protein
MLRVKTLASPHCCTNSKRHTKQCAQFRLTANSNDRQPSASSLTAGELPMEWSIESPASSAQNHTGYSQTVLTSWYFEPPPSLLCHTSSQNLNPLPLEVWHHLRITPRTDYMMIIVSQEFGSWLRWPTWNTINSHSRDSTSCLFWHFTTFHPTECYNA